MESVPWPKTPATVKRKVSDHVNQSFAEMKEMQAQNPLPLSTTKRFRDHAYVWVTLLSGLTVKIPVRQCTARKDDANRDDAAAAAQEPQGCVRIAEVKAALSEFDAQHYVSGRTFIIFDQHNVTGLDDKQIPIGANVYLVLAIGD